MIPSILVAGIGNIFLGDDAFGVEVARRLSSSTLPGNVTVKDFGIRGFDLAFTMMDGYDVTIFVDALPRGGEPGSVYLFEPDLQHPEITSEPQGAIETHGMNPVNVLRLVHAMGGVFKKVLVVGCEPASFGREDEGFVGLSEVVEAAVPEAMNVIQKLLQQMQEEQDGRKAIV